MTTSTLFGYAGDSKSVWQRACNKLQAESAVCGCLPGSGSIMKDAFKVWRAGSNVSGTPSIFQTKNAALTLTICLLQALKQLNGTEPSFYFIIQTCAFPLLRYQNLSLSTVFKSVWTLVLFPNVDAF